MQNKIECDKIKKENYEVSNEEKIFVLFLVITMFTSNSLSTMAVEAEELLGREESQEKMFIYT